MRSAFGAVGVLAGVLAAHPGQGGAPASKFLALVGGRIYASPTAPPLDDGVAIVDGSKIEWVGPRRLAAIPAGAATIDCRGRFVTAGFQNSHVHFTEDKWDDAGHQRASKLAGQLQSMLTQYGFSVVVDTASLLPNTLALRQRITSGEVAGPRIFTAGLALYPPDGVPYYVRDVVPSELLKRLPQPSTAKEAIADVRANIDGGADLVKLFTGSWVARGRVLAMPVPVASAAVVEAHARGRLVFSHPSSLAGLQVALESHVDVLAHAIEDTRGLTVEHLRTMKRQNMALVPTLELFGGDGNIAEIAAEVGDYARLGGEILFGTDVGYLSDYSPAGEYQLLRRAGLTSREILASLTTSPARRFKESGRRGSLAPGMDADIVVLGSDPIADARAFTDVRMTIRAGRIVFAKP